ncbi:S8 family peptidase [Amycolatopsis cihanbeyliensis]|uniref:PA domain-containing protein n=1 Tax=Amycolatopsis cihanbeyliensis TaxID=1128664 RepID=A0A542DI21_AMYCI|nr:S8 family serine peptidase [Amycolatopsis cihanbeyliensis]TQJ02674.1 PA domain-containing protein [Amycolatopsis cihanbeyliensis]
MTTPHTRTARRRFRRSLLAFALLAVQAIAYPSQVAAADPSEPRAAASPAEAVHRVTLLTGDEVTYTEHADGTRAARIDAAPRPDRPPVTFETVTTADGLFVYPSDAMPYVRADVLDRDLFNLTGLVGEGLADASASTLPVLASYGQGGTLSAESLRTRANGLPAARPHTAVRTLGGVGVRVDKADAEKFWAAVAADPGTDGELRHGLAELELDHTVRVSLDRSAAQVGAPTAWDSGLDGSGTTVAVVDTGVDADHPDLAGRVTETANFTSEQDATDLHGHGTHVASIAAGSGAASGGSYRGIAPGADLLAAKVFDRWGTGPASQVMAGMEWAVDRGADVVNLSLGAGITDGTDPLAAMVNTLSAKNGTLFVVAAGNAGPGNRTVTTPGSADAALTVGAVDRNNELAWFSSRGPRLTDATVKPEIVAPGVEIAAARAAGTSGGSPLGEHYTRWSGTSMATPHVAGAAAILAQQHPDWSGARLKDRLVSTARDLELPWFEQGAGLLDIARAIGQPVSAPASANFGRQQRNGQDLPRVPHELTYTNTGDTPVALELSLEVKGWNGRPAPAATMRLTDRSVSIAPGASATTTVSVDPDIGATGVYGGTVVATATGGTTLRTPVSTYNAPRLFPLDVRVTDSTGKPATAATVEILDDTSGAAHGNDPFQDKLTHRVDLVNGAGRVLLPTGTYSALGRAMERNATSMRWSALSRSEVEVREATEIHLDATETVPVRTTGQEPLDQLDRFVALRRVIPAQAGRPSFISEVSLGAGALDWDVYVTPAAATGRGAITLQDTLSLRPAMVRASVRGHELHPEYDATSLAEKWPGEHVLPLVFAGTGSAENLTGLDVRGKIVMVGLPAPPDDAVGVGQAYRSASSAARHAAKAGATAVVSYVDLPGALPVGGLSSTGLPHLSLSHEEGTALRAALASGESKLTVRVQTAPEKMYNLSFLEENGIPADQVRQVDPAELIATRTTYHADRPGLSARKTWYAFPTGLWMTQFLRGTTVPSRGTVTEYVGPGNDRTVWRRSVALSGTGDNGRLAKMAMYQQNIYRPGESSRPDEHWFRAPMHSMAVELQPDNPALYPGTVEGWRQLCSSCRGGGGDPDQFVPPLQWGDGNPGHFTSPYANAQHFSTTTTKLFQGDREIPRANRDEPLALFPVYELSPDPTRYTLRVSDAMADRPVIGAPSTTLFRHATRTDTEWNFTSTRPNGTAPRGFNCYGGGTNCAFQPLIQLEHRFPLDQANQAPAGTGFTFTTSAASHSKAPDGSPVMWLHVSYSTDGGRTWRQATADPQGSGEWEVTVTHPELAETDGFVWLRSEARDSSGNTVDQTMRRAYSLKSPPPAVPSVGVR